MTAPRAILSVRHTPATGAGLRLAGGFSRYIQYRDNELEKGKVVDADSFTRYAAYRDEASPQGRLFDSEGTIGDEERRALVEYIRRTTERDRELDAQNRPGRAFYRMVISPEDARHVDLRQLTRETLRQLEKDVGRIPPWIAAEHRNTRHPHVHVVMAARLEQEPGRFRTVLITKPRLERMKQVTTSELTLQRELGLARDLAPRLGLERAIRAHPHRDQVDQSLVRMVGGHTRVSRAVQRHPLAKGAASILGAMAAEFAKQIVLQQAEVERKLRDEERRRAWERARGD